MSGPYSWADVIGTQRERNTLALGHPMPEGVRFRFVIVDVSTCAQAIVWSDVIDTADPESEAAVLEWVAAFDEDRYVPPLVWFCGGWHDGNHRFEAAVRHRTSHVFAFVADGETIPGCLPTRFLL